MGKSKNEKWNFKFTRRIEKVLKMKQKVSLWLGNFASQEEFQEYFKISYKEDGATRFQKFKPDPNYQEGIIGGKDGTSFWLSKDHADVIQDVAKGDNRLYETLLGFDEGYLGDDPLYRLDVAPEVVSEKGISIPSGREDGANGWWRPGGRTYPGDMPEGVMDGISIKEGDVTWNAVN